MVGQSRDDVPTAVSGGKLSSRLAVNKNYLDYMTWRKCFFDKLTQLCQKTQSSLVACVYFPDRVPQGIQDAIEARGYTIRRLIELAKKRQH